MIAFAVPSLILFTYILTSHRCGATRQHKWMYCRIGVKNERLSNQKSVRRDSHGDAGSPCMFRGIFQKRADILNGKM
jgi:hypothetical protein